MGKRDFFKKNRFVVSSTQTNAHRQVVVDRAPMSGLPRTPQSSPSRPAGFDIPADINATLDWEEEVPPPGLQSKVRPVEHATTAHVVLMIPTSPRKTTWKNGWAIGHHGLIEF